MARVRRCPCSTPQLAGKESSHWPTAGTDLRGLALSSTGRLVAIRRSDGNVDIHDARTGQKQNTLDLLTPKDAAALAREGLGGGLFAPVFSTDGALLAVSEGFAPKPEPGLNIRLGTVDYYVQLWETATGRPLRKIKVTRRTTAASVGPGWWVGGIYDNCFSPDGRLLATNCVTNDHDKSTVDVWEILSGKRRIQFKLPHGPTIFAPNGKAIVSGGEDGVIRFISTDTGKELCHLDGHGGAIGSLAITPDGKTLVSGSADTTVLVFDVANLIPEQKRPVVEVSASRMDALWQELGNDDAGKAFQAMQELETAKATVGFFRDRVKSIAELDPKTVAALMADLDSPQFPVRQKATEALELLGVLAAPALRQALAKQPGLDLAKRLEAILKKLEGSPVTADDLQTLRALEVLERIGSPEARQVVAEIAKGAAGAPRTSDARAALERLKAREQR